MKTKEEFKDIVEEHVNKMEKGIDPDGICLDFNDYCEAMYNHMYLFFKKRSRDILNEETWISKSI